MAVSREKLYAEVWTEPMTTVAARYDVSSSFLARVCERLKVPRPARGYWALKAVGRAPAKPPLPDVEDGDELEWSRDGNARTAPVLWPSAPGPASDRVARPREKRPIRHDLVVEARELFEKGRVSDSGYLIPSKRLLVDVFASKKAIDRALDVANELFLTLEDQGHRVMLAPLSQRYERAEIDERLKTGTSRYGHARWCPARPTVVFVGTVAIGLTLFELSEEVEVAYVDGRWVRISDLPTRRRRTQVAGDNWTHKREMPTARLSLRASSPYPRTTWEKQWQESKAGDLPGTVPEILRCLEEAAPRIATLIKEAERKMEVERRDLEAQREVWRRQEQERQRVQAVKESTEELFGVIESWGVAKRMEAFFADIERRAADLGDADRAALLERLHAARELLGGVDALERFREWRSRHLELARLSTNDVGDDGGAAHDAPASQWS